MMTAKTNNTNNSHHPPLDKIAYSALYRIASFLPPSSNWTLKQVSRNFTDVVERLTENWVIPFIFCDQHNHITHTGLFHFSSLEVSISEKLETPKIDIRTGKTSYQEVNYDSTAVVVKTFLAENSETLKASAKSCPMCQPIMLLVDSAPLARVFENYIVSQVRFPAPAGMPLNNSTAKEGSSNQNQKPEQNDNNNDEEEQQQQQPQIVPSIWNYFLLPHSHTDSLDKAKAHRSETSKITPDLIRSSILSTVFSINPGKVTAFSGTSNNNNESSSDNNNHSILAKNGSDAARHCGRPPFSVLFSQNLSHPHFSHRTVGLEKAKEIKALDAAIAKTLSEAQGPVQRRLHGVKTSPSLCNIMSDVRKLYDFDTDTYPLLKTSLPCYDPANPKCTTNDKTWENFWSKRVFILYNNNTESPSFLQKVVEQKKSEEEKEEDEAMTMKRAASADDAKNYDVAAAVVPPAPPARAKKVVSLLPPPTIRTTVVPPPEKPIEHFQNREDNVASPLSKWFKASNDDRLLVGENEAGTPVEISFEKLVYYFGTTALENQGHSEEAFTNLFYSELSKQRNTINNNNNNNTNVSSSSFIKDDENQTLKFPHPSSSASLKIAFLSTWVFRDQEFHGDSRRLFIADDVSLGTIMAEELYFPNPLLKPQNCIWKNAQDNVKNITNTKEHIRLTTPWILIGEKGTFSDEHIEPENLHVWVHLFKGIKCWFIEKKETNQQEDHEDEVNNVNDVEWEMFFQYPNQTIVIPPNWRHFVLNICPTFAVARNF